MKLLILPTELLIEIVQYLPNIRDKCQVLQTCSQLKHLLCTQLACWTHLDFSPYSTINNGELLNFLKDKHIRLYNLTPMITRLDLSGCWCLSQDMIVGLSRTFSNLNELYLNGYRLQSTQYQERDHLYQMRPSHDLASMTMDLSKKAMYQLKVPLILLVSILGDIDMQDNIKTLSIQYQDLTPIQYSYSTIFSQIQHLDISSCVLSQAGLQTLIRKSGRQLISLKMLNIELNTLSWLSLGQLCRKLICLHVSCSDSSYLGCVRHCISNLNKLQDFRLTRIRTGSLDSTIGKLNPQILRRLDLSPKMHIYLNGSRKLSAIKTTEHDLLLSDMGLNHLFVCHQLVELRLCFPMVSSEYLYTLYQSLPQLEIFELRRQERQQEEDDLKGLNYLINLKEIYLYSVIVTNQCLDTIATLPLSHVTIVCHNPIDHTILYRSNDLKSIHLGQNFSFQKKGKQWCKL